MLSDIFIASLVEFCVVTLFYQTAMEHVHFLLYKFAKLNIKLALQNNDIFICPILAGSGMKSKILHASMAGLPIVSTFMRVEGFNNDICDFVYIGNNAK